MVLFSKIVFLSHILCFISATKCNWLDLCITSDVTCLGVFLNHSFSLYPIKFVLYWYIIFNFKLCYISL